MGAATQLAGVMQGGVNQIKAWMPMIGDLAAASGLSIQETTNQIIRMYSAGAQAADMFRERGILAMLGFQAGVHYSVEDTRRMLMEAWKEPTSKFRDATKELAKTWDGAMSMLSDTWFKFRNDIMGAGVFDVLKEQLTTLNKAAREWIENNQDQIRDWAHSLANDIKAIAGAVKTIGQYAGLKSISKTFVKGREMAAKGYFEWAEFVKAGFLERQRMVEEALTKELHGGRPWARGKIRMPEIESPTVGVDKTKKLLRERVDAIRQSLKKEAEYEKWLANVEKDVRQKTANELQAVFDEQDQYIKQGLEAQAEAFKKAEEEKVKAAKKAADKIKEQNRQIAEFFSYHYTQAFMSVIEGTKSVKDAFRNMAHNIIFNLIRMRVEAEATAAIQALLGGIGSGGGGFLGGIFRFVKGLFFHQGGVVGQTPVPQRLLPAPVFAGAPRLHSGLRADEYPAILQKGETVLPKGAGKEEPTILINNDFNGATFMNDEQLQTAIETVSAKMVYQLAPGAVVRSYENDEKIRSIIRARK